MRKLHLNLGVCISGAVLIFGAAIFIQSRNMKYWVGYGPGDAFVATWASGFLVFFALIALFQAAHERGIKLSEVLPKGDGLKNLLVTWLGLLFFLGFVQVTGFLVTASAMMFFLYSRGYKWQYALALSIAVSLVSYIIFKSILQVPLPVSMFGW